MKRRFVSIILVVAVLCGMMGVAPSASAVTSWEHFVTVLGQSCLDFLGLSFDLGEFVFPIVGECTEEDLLFAQDRYNSWLARTIRSGSTLGAIKRFRRYLKKHGHPPVEYIAAAEPQGRGAWHLHVLLLFSEKAPFIPNAHMAKLWGQGHTKTKSLKGVDNPGLYLTAYLGDMELAEAAMSGATRGRLGEVETVDEHGQRQKKAIIKGARLHLYPPRVQPLPLLPWREAAPGHADGRVEGPGDHRGRTLDLRKDHSRDRRPGPDLEHHKLPPV